MREFSTEFAEHLQREVTTLCWCWKLERTDGVQTLGFTNHDQIISYDGLDYNPCDGLTEESRSDVSGQQSGSSVVRGILSDSRITDADVIAGKWDSAQVTIDRVNWKNTTIRETIYTFQIGSIQKQGDSFKAEMFSRQFSINQRVGRVYQKACDTSLGSSRCKIDLDETMPVDGVDVPKWYLETPILIVLSGNEFSFGYQTEGTTSDDGNGLANSNPPVVSLNFFTNGYMEFITGKNAGIRLDIRSQRLRDIITWTPAPLEASAGDMVRLYAGCDKTTRQCREKFDNLVNHQGFPLIATRDNILPSGSRSRTFIGGSFFEGVIE